MIKFVNGVEKLLRTDEWDNGGSGAGVCFWGLELSIRSLVTTKQFKNLEGTVMYIREDWKLQIVKMF